MAPATLRLSRATRPKPSSATTAPRPGPASRSSTALNHRYQTVDFVRAKRQDYLARSRRKMSIWDALEYPQHAGRRQRPRHRAAADRALPANGRGHPPRRPSALVHPHRPDPRPGQDPLPVRRAAMGRGGRHVSRRLRVLAEDRVPRVLRRQSRQPACPSIRRAAASTPRAAVWTTCSCRGATTSTCTTW